MLLAAVRRRWRLAAMGAVTGLLAGLALTIVHPVPFTGEATVMVGHPSGADPARNVVTDVVLATSAAVAEDASERLGGKPSVATLLASLRADAPSSELVDIEVDSPTAAQAVSRAEAVAAAFADFRRRQSDSQSAAVTEAIGQRLRSLSEELAALLDRIGVLGGDDPAVSPNVQGLSELGAQRVELSSRIDTLSQESEAAGFDAETVRARTGVVHTAYLRGRPSLRATALNLGACALAGLALGVGWVIAAALTSNRVGSRDEVSRALGVPVAASVGRERRWRGPAEAARPDPGWSAIWRPCWPSVVPAAAGFSSSPSTRSARRRRR